MFNLMNQIDAALHLLDELHRLSLLALPYLKTVWKFVTAEKTRRVLRAIGLAVLVLGAIVLCGMLEVGRLAVREATITFRAQLVTTVAKSEAAVTTGGSEPDADALISRQTGVRLLRQVATQRGIRNAGRMRKPELWAVLQLG